MTVLFRARRRFLLAVALAAGPAPTAFAASDGSPARLPDGAFRWEAEDFTGGAAPKNGVDYKDATPGNQGGKYRETDVDIEACSEGGHDVGFIDAGEWLKYAFTGGGTFVARVRHASLSPAAVRFEVDGSHGWVSESNLRFVRACRDGF